MGAEENLPGLRFEPAPQKAGTREQLAWEKELLGLYISHHPLDEYADYLADTCVPIAEVTPGADGKLLRLGGIITTVRKILTKKGDTMAFVGLEDKTGSTELIVFPKAFEKNPDVFEADNVIMATGKISARDREGNLTGEPKLMVDVAKIVNYDVAKDHVSTKQPIKKADAKPSSTISAASGEHVVLQLADLSDQQLLHDIKELVSANAGESEIFILVGDDDPKKIRLPFKVSVTEDLIIGLGRLVGTSKVTYTS
ncbi:MAG: hypothetical protein NVS3B29_03240 [Candidatus Saccharimonadales bacterium]